jgi:hypothetical protein
MQAIQCAPHEFAANFVFHGLDPWFAADSIVKDHGGSTGYIDFESAGERWQARLSYQSSNLLPPAGGQTLAGTTIQHETIREFRFKVRRHPEEDSVEKQDFVAHIAPRWHEPHEDAKKTGMWGEKKDGSITKVTVPARLTEGVNVRIDGSNIEFGRYRQLLDRAAEAAGLSAYHFETPDDELSNVLDAEMYVRLDREQSGPIHARDGPLARMGHLLEHDRTGRRKLDQNDDDNHGRNLPGFYHTATLDRARIREAFPSHHLAKEVKHYYAREALAMPDDHPLRHPKLGASYQRSFMRHDDDPIRPDADSLDELRTELVETVLSVLDSAGLDLDPSLGSDLYVSDAYFDADRREDVRDLPRLELDHIQHEQENTVITTFAELGGLSPVEQETIETLLADGGQVSPTDVAEKHGRHVDSVRRAARRIDDLLDRTYGEIRIRSSYVAGLLSDAIDRAKEAFSTAAKTIDTVRRAEDRGLDESTSAFLAWAASHGVDHKDARDARLELRLGKVEGVRELKAKVSIGFNKWLEAGRDRTRYTSATVKAQKPGENFERTYTAGQILKR